MSYLGSKFESGMAWDNYGKDGWEVDHKVPDSLFYYSTVNDVQFKECWSLSNLQPMWASDNRSKSNKFTGGY